MVVVFLIHFLQLKPYEENVHSLFRGTKRHAILWFFWIQLSNLLRAFVNWEPFKKWIQKNIKTKNTSNKTERFTGNKVSVICTREPIHQQEIDVLNRFFTVLVSRNKLLIEGKFMKYLICRQITRLWHFNTK